MAMEIVVTANGADLSSLTSPVFGRCSAYLFVDPETLHLKAMGNPAPGTLRGAGFQAAEFVVERGAQAVVTCNVGPNAFGVLQALGVPVYLFDGGTVRDAIEAYKTGRLHPVEEASVRTHTGRARNMRTDAGRGIDEERCTQKAAPPALAVPPASREDEITALKETAGELRERLTQVLERLEHLEKEDER
jgi:predicted Fe-Mo cluster-binding NifX family protein